MKSHYRVVVIGGGIVGASVLYHLTRKGWGDIALIERAELTAGSTWHAAAGFHAINDDPHIAALQAYTIKLYQTIEAESGQSVGMHMPGGYSIATTPERWEWLQSEFAIYETIGIEARLATPEEIVAECPIVDPRGLLGGLFDPHEGAVDPHGTTHAFAIAARRRGAEVILRNRVTGLKPHADGWLVETEQGTVVAQHVVNAGGLWARRVGRMAGVDLPLTPMQHHYLITEDLPELLARPDEMPCVTDLEGFTYLQQERKGVILGVYERNPRHWQTEGAEWDYGMELLPEDIDRISPELLIGFSRFPTLERAGIRKWVNGAFTFTPDGNPLVGPVPGLRNFWAACGCMSGFSQGGAIGKVLSEWMVEGDPGTDIFGMDVARYGRFAADDRYLRDTTAQFYARRFVIAYPNEELPAGRPLKTTPSYAAQKALGARFGVVWGMESPQYFAADEPEFVEPPTLRRSAADRFVAAEVAATRAAAGLLDTGVYARYEVRGPGAGQWLDYLLASRLPAVGRIRLAPMLSPAGRLMGDLTVTRLDADRYWLVGSYYLQEWHLRWFRDHLPAAGVEIENLSESWLGFSLSGPRSREILASLTTQRRFRPRHSVHGLRQHRSRIDVRGRRAPLAHRRARLRDQRAGLAAARSLAGVDGRRHSTRHAPDRHARAGQPAARKGLRRLVARVLHVLHARDGGLERFVAADKGDFIGRDAVLAARESGPEMKLVLLQVESPEADATGYEPIHRAGQRIGYVTSGAYGHHVRQSLALAYVDTEWCETSDPLSATILGKPRAARILRAPPYDPTGSKLRG